MFSPASSLGQSIKCVGMTMEGSVNLSRRGFLRAKPSVQIPLRPPWSLLESNFLRACSRCDGCRTACPTGIVVRGSGGFPEVDFARGECTFCGACATHCRSGALQHDAAVDTRPWSYRARIEEACLAQRNVVCRSCGDACEARAIRFRPRLGGAALPEVDWAACSGCGACVRPCPTHAIAMTNHQEGAVQ